jgi:Zn finger protein HypA/HybF involved in hydrogenase expression
MKILSAYQLSKMPVKRLLAYKKKRFPCENYPGFVEDYVHTCDCPDCEYVKKQINEYKENYILVKTELNKREHVDRKS